MCGVFRNNEVEMVTENVHSKQMYNTDWPQLCGSNNGQRKLQILLCRMHGFDLDTILIWRQRAFLSLLSAFVL